tara:strand:+ start:701 stop:1024 length:324 start_codon:yes stop_codon:yes gene_type:complete
MVSVEFFIRSDFKLIVFSLMAVSQKAIKIIKSDNISDCWKEKTIPIYAISMFKYSIKSFLILILILTIFFLPSFLVDNFFYFSLSIFGIIESIVFCLAYFEIRKIIF